MTEDQTLPQVGAHDRAAYLEHRKQLIELGMGQINLFDKTIIFVSSGALGLSFAFIDTLSGSGPAASTPLLLLAWIMLTLAILFNILSYKTSWRDTDLEVKKLDESYEKGEAPAFTGNLFRAATLGLNYGSLATLTLGIVLLFLFAFQNLEP